MSLDKSSPPHPSPLPSGEKERPVGASLLQPLLSPRSVAIVGQSDDATKTAGRPLKLLRQAGYAGTIYPINPRRETVLGERAWPSIAALPETPEHAYIVTGTEAAVEAVAACGKRGVKIATVLADGFAETGPEGLAREARLRAIVAETGIRLVGPSSWGVIDLRSRAMLTGNPTFDEPDIRAGRIFVASHSGGMIGSLFSRGSARGIAFAGFVAVGNEVDLSLGEICEATLDDPGIDSYMLFLETMRHAGALRRFALAAAERGKPILAYKLGRSAAAQELAVSHTGALAGEDDIADMVLAECGIARVLTLDGLIEGMPLLSRVPLARRTAARKTVGVLTTTAGGATMVVDPLAMRGLNVVPPSAQTLARISKAAGFTVKPARMVDLTIAGANYDAMKGTLDAMLAAPEFDFVLAVVGASGRSNPERTVRPIIESAGAEKPLAAFIVPDAPKALAMLSAAGVPSFRTPEACADAIAAALSRRMPRDLVKSTVPTGQPAPRPPRSGGEWSGVGGGTAPRLLDEHEAYALLNKLGVACAPVVALDANITQAPALPFPYPVAVKVLSAEIAHKTDVGGVMLKVADSAGLIAAIQNIRNAVAKRAPGKRAERVLVQQMMSGLGEALIGYRVDGDVGPIVLVAAGGVLTEIAHDRALRLAPVDVATAHEMIAEVRGLIPLTGYRGKPKGDVDALAQAIVSLSRLAEDPRVAEAEINPLIVMQTGVVAVDALVKLT
jgi:acyl-CoA synthetase (NDP forming)